MTTWQELTSESVRTTLICFHYVSPDVTTAALCSSIFSTWWCTCSNTHPGSQRTWNGWIPKPLKCYVLTLCLLPFLQQKWPKPFRATSQLRWYKKWDHRLRQKNNSSDISFLFQLNAEELHLPYISVFHSVNVLGMLLSNILEMYTCKMYEEAATILRHNRIDRQSIAANIVFQLRYHANR